MQVHIIERSNLYEGFFKLEKAVLQFEKFDGTMSEKVSRLNVYRGDAVAVLLYDSKRGKIILVRQFRYPIHTVEPENGWLLEVVAGSIENNCDPIETAVRETEEEAGYKLDPSLFTPLGKCYPSPGGTSERVYLFTADVAEIHRANDGGGLDEEHEDIQLVELDYQEAFQMVDEGEICDAKSLLTLQWLRGKIRSEEHTSELQSH